MSWTVTLILAAIFLAVVLACGWRGAQAPNLQRGPRLIPYRLFMLLGSAALLVLLAHMAGMAGLLPPSRPF